MTYKFGARSLGNLEGINRDLRLVCNRALELTPIDFTIVEGLRSEKRQLQLMNDGKSQTMNSKHITGDAIDFWPYWCGKARGGWPFFYPVADAFRTASMELNIPVVWGGAWGVDLWSAKSAQDAQEYYIKAKEQQNQKPFFDGPHIELTARGTRQVTVPA